MGSVCGWSDDEERSVIGEKGELPFIDYQEDRSVCNYDQNDDDPYVISAPFPFVSGNPQSVIVGEVAKDSFTIKNNTDEQVDIWSISIYASEPEDSFILSLKDPSPSDSTEYSAQAFYGKFSLEDRVLPAGQTLLVWLSVKPESIGTYKTSVHVNIGSETIERVAILMVDNKISQSLASNRPYSRVAKKKHHEAAKGYVRGVRPVRKEASGRFRKRLPMYPIPTEIREWVADKQIPDVLKSGLSRENYIPFFHTLLNLEELTIEEDMRAFDMERVYICRKGTQYLTLEVPGLAERRPSVVSGDSVFVRPEYENDEKFEGVVHRVEADEIYMKFDKDFHNRHRDENLYNVEFTYNRTNMRRSYAAIEGAQNLEMALLFPSSERKRRIRTTPLVPISCMLNEEQMCAIEMIVGCRGLPPYLIHGPPGTGKTVTIVEAILQLYRMGEKQQDVRILVCAPSNSAADHILEKLIGSGELREREVFRLNAVSRSREEVIEEIMPFCFFDEVELCFMCPALNALRRFRIIISTYMSASHLVAEGVARGHFSHIFLDEAGQASEPESMIPLSNLCNKNTVVVLAGDPMQLGPIVHSKTAERFGLGKSYMERLLESSGYYGGGGGGDENYVTRLVRNYRCHPEILHLPSELFYKGELQACREDTSYLDMGDIQLVPNKDFPIVFIGIQGCDEREGNNPSWFNRIEASKVVEVIEEVKELVGERDIGIITPYRQQVLKMKKAFESIGMSDIKIGSVEQFQGQEREVMVVSTVRSTVKHNEFDRVHCLGFLSNPRRFNVAVTRAISLLVIVGNPHIICKDPYWNKLLWYCVDNNSYKGCTLPNRDDENKDLVLVDVDARNNDDGANWNNNYNNWEEEEGKNNGNWDDNNSWDEEGKNNGNWDDNNSWDEEDKNKQEQETLQNHPINNEDDWADGWKS